MTVDQVMKTLKAKGTASGRQTYLRHGASEPVFGVRVADMKTILKKTKKDHDLALELLEHTLRSLPGTSRDDERARSVALYVRREPVDDADAEQAWSFRNDVQSVFSKIGCNSGACHGALAGKGGFKLSLRGYHPAGDYQSITRAARGRRPRRPRGEEPVQHHPRRRPTRSGRARAVRRRQSVRPTIF